jgi:hypothetical protein
LWRRPRPKLGCGAKERREKKTWFIKATPNGFCGTCNAAARRLKLILKIRAGYLLTIG